MALAATGIFEIQSGATAGNVNGGYFNPANAGMLSDLTTTTTNGNTAAPVVKSASYNFVSGDVGNWLYIKSGTNWNVGWYKIQSVASNQATLEAAVGSVNVRQVVNNLFVTNTLIGCATVATPTSGTFTIDYSQKATCIASTAVSDYASAISSVTLTSATAAFTPVMVGNGFCLSGSGTGAHGLVTWYEIATYVNATTVTTSSTTNNGNALLAGVGKIGGAISLGGSTVGITDSDLMNTVSANSSTAAMRYFVQGGSSITYTLGVATTFKQGSATWATIAEGYGTVRGDRPQGATRPIFACGANVFTKSGKMFSIIFTGTGTSVVSNGAAQTGGFTMSGCKIVNSSATAGRAAMLARNSGSGTIYNNEFISYRGIAVSDIAAIITGAYLYNYIHDSDTGFQTSPSATGSGQVTISGNIIEGCVTYCIDGVNVIPPDYNIIGNTFYGAENKLGIALGIQTSDAQDITVLNNIFYGFSTVMSIADVQAVWTGDYNNFFNNTNDINTVNHWQKGINDIAVNPTFQSVAQVTGTTATTTAGNHLVDSGASFIIAGVTAGRDYLLVKSGTGVTAGIYGILSVDSATQITTDIALTANATGDKVYQITTGHNLQVGSPMEFTGLPAAFPAGLTTSAVNAGAVQKIWNTYARGSLVNAT